MRHIQSQFRKENICIPLTVHRSSYSKTYLVIPGISHYVERISPNCWDDNNASTEIADLQMKYFCPQNILRISHSRFLQWCLPFSVFDQRASGIGQDNSHDQIPCHCLFPCCGYWYVGHVLNMANRSFSLLFNAHNSSLMEVMRHFALLFTCYNLNKGNADNSRDICTIWNRSLSEKLIR